MGGVMGAFIRVPSERLFLNCLRDNKRSIRKCMARQCPDFSDPGPRSTHWVTGRYLRESARSCNIIIGNLRLLPKENRKLCGDICERPKTPCRYAMAAIATISFKFLITAPLFAGLVLFCS